MGRRRPPVRAAWALAAAALGGLGCEAVNRIDVCDRGPGTERQVNGHTDGDQRIENTRSIVALPSGGALVTFTSLAAPDAVQSEVRGAVLSGDGVTLRTCDADAEASWVEVDQAGPARQLRQRPTLGRPLGEGVYGLLAYDATVGGSQELQVFVQALDTDGCLSGAPLQISNEPAGATASWLQVVPTGVRQFVVVWASVPADPNAVSPPPVAIRARAVSISPGFPIAPLPTVLSKAGDAVDLVSNTYFAAAAAAERGDFGVLVAWIELALDKRAVHLTSYDAVLHETGDVIAAEAPVTPLPDEVGIDVASDGTQALVAWVERDGAQRARVWGRYYAPMNLAGLRAPQAPDGEAFTLGASTASTDEGHPSLAVVPGGGLAAFWDETGDPTRADTSGASVRALLLGADGGRQFANLACGKSDFQLNVGANSDQLHPNGVVLKDGTLLAVWTDLGENGTDRFADSNGAGVRDITFSPRILRPLP